MKFITLNLAHGRAAGLHQWLQRRAKIEANLNRVADTLRHEHPDVVALQEADGPCFWSGSFNHIEYLADAAGLPYSVRGEHVRGRWLSYGTAILSRVPLRDAVAVTFARSPPTTPKGFVVAEVSWPDDPKVTLDVVSLHLDFLRTSVRHGQLRTVASVLAMRDRPRVVMGDFNCQWEGRGETVGQWATSLDLRAYHPTAPNMVTFPLRKTRLDWILVSHPFTFAKHKTLADRLSDHRAVVAVLRRAEHHR